MLSFSLFFVTYNDVRSLAIKYTENNVVNIPMPKVTENPLTGPDPKKNKIIAEIKVVTLASRTAVLDLL